MGRRRDPEYKRNWARSPKGKYAAHKAQAASRGIEFTLSFEQWWALWQPHWSLRGKAPGCYCMKRKGDKGGYTPGNVIVGPVSSNLKEQLGSGQHVSRKLSRKQVDQALVMTLDHTQAVVARQYGVSQPEVSRLVHGRRGKYIAQEEHQ